MAIATYSWQTSGIVGAGFQNAVAIDPRNNGVVISGADVSGLHRSADWGDTWVTVNVGLYSTNHLCVAGMRFSATNPDVVLAAIGRRGTGGGLFVSLDNGRTWTLASTTPQWSGANNTSPLPSTHPRSTGNVLAWDETDNVVYAGTYSDGVMRAALNATTGAGATSWTTLGLAGKYVRSIVRADQDTLFAATYDDKVYRLTNIRATATATKLTASPAKPEELTIVGSHIYCVSSDTTDGGVWRAALATPTTWTKINDANVDTSSAKWEAIVGYANPSDGKHHVWIGCANPDPAAGTYRPSVMRCLDAAAGAPAWASITSNGTYVHTTIGGPSGRDWWLMADQPTMAIGRGSYVTSQLAVSPDRTRMFSAGRSGMWRAASPAAANPDWYPVVEGMAVTICRDVAADPDLAGAVYVDNTDWVFFTSSDHGQTCDQNRPSPNTGFAVATDPQAGRVLVATGDRDTATLGKLWSAAAPASGSWTDEKLNSGAGGTAVVGGDSFTRTTSGGSWGNTSDDAKTYQLIKSGNLDSNLALCTGSVGRVDLTPTPDNTAGGALVTRLGTGASGATKLALTSPQMSGRFRFSVDATGSSQYGALVVLGQWANTWTPGVNSYYEARIQQAQTTGKPKTLKVYRSDGGTLVQVNTDTDISTYGVSMAPGAWVWMRFHAIQNGGNVDLYVRLWDYGDPEPDTWAWTGTDTGANRITQAGGVGTKSGFNSGYTAAGLVEYDDLDWIDAVSTGGSGGLRPLGVGAATPASDPIVIAAVENDATLKGGIWRKVASAWTQIDATMFTAQNTKSIPVEWAPQSGATQTVFIFDRADGVYRSTDNGSSWTRIWAKTSNSESTGYIAYDPGAQILYASAGGTLYRIANAATCGADAAAPATLSVTNVGPIATDSVGRLYVTRKVSSTKAPGLLVSDDQGATFTDVADAVYRGSGGIPFGMSVGGDDYIYIALNGNGMIVGTPSSTGGGGGGTGGGGGGGGGGTGGGGGGGLPPPDHPPVGEYRIFVSDLTGPIRAEIPYSELKWSEAVGKPGGATFVSPASHRDVGRWNLDPGRTAVHIDRSGVIVASGILWGARPKSRDFTIEFTFDGWLSIFDHRTIREYRWYPQSDPIGIVRDLVARSQTDTAGTLTGDLGIAIDYSVFAGVLRDIEYPANERRPILEAIAKLADVDVGAFEYAIVPRWGDGQIGTVQKTLLFWTPGQGRDLSDSVVVRNGENVTIDDYQINAKTLANRVDGLGKGDGPSQLVSTRYDDTDPRFPLLDDAVTWRDIDSQAVLDARTAAELAARKVTPDVGKVTLLDGKRPRFGDVVLGDTVTVDLDDGYWQWAGKARVVGQDVKISKSGAEEVTWTLADPNRTGTPGG